MSAVIALMGKPSTRSSKQAVPSVHRAPAWSWGAYLILLIAAELIIALSSVELGIAVHFVLLVTLPIHAAFATPSERALLTAMGIAPLIRIVNLAMPVSGLSLLAQYVLTSLPLAVAVVMTIRVLGLSRREIGLRLDGLPVQLLVGLLGLPIGALMYGILRPAPALPELHWGGVLFAVLVFLLSIGFLEELIFRGVLQTASGRTFGEWGVAYVSAVFATLHLGYLSPPHVGLVFMIGLIFSWLVTQTRSVVGVALAHGLTNVVLYLVFPLVVVPAGWTLPDVSWTGYVSSPSPGRATTAPSWAGDRLQIGARPTPVAGQQPTTVVRDAPAAPAPASPVPSVVPAQAERIAAAPTTGQQVARPKVHPIFLPPPPVTILPLAVERVRVDTIEMVNVRALPSLYAEVLIAVDPGEILDVVGVDQDGDGLTWRNVRLGDGRIGWISRELVEVAAPTPAADRQPLGGANAPSANGVDAVGVAPR